MLRGWRNLTPALGLLALAAWLPVVATGLGPKIQPGLAGRAPAGAVRGMEPGAYPWLRPGQVVWYGNVRQKVVALTFDGLDPKGTPALLATLARHGGQATFFVTGDQAARYPQLARGIVERGHELGNGGQTGRSLEQRSAAEIAAELRQAGAAISTATGRQPRLFRPPGGGVVRTVVEAAGSLGYRSVFWSWAPAERPGEGIAVAPGDILALPAGDAAVDALLAQLARQGYRFVTVSALLGAADKS